MVYLSKLVFCYPFLKMSKNVRFSLFSVQKIDRHKIIYKDLKNFLHHALIVQQHGFFTKKSLDFFLNWTFLKCPFCKYRETFYFLCATVKIEPFFKYLKSVFKINVLYIYE